MLELIFQGFLQWGYGLTLECWEYFSSSLLDIMSMDFAYLKSHVPVLDDIMQILLAVGWALLIGNLIFQALKSMASGLGFEGEDPKLLFTRTFIFAFLLLASPQICQMGLDITSRIMALLEVPDAVNVTLVEESAFGALTAAWVLVIIFGVIIMFKVFKLLLEIAERYLILAMLTITAPLAFSMGGSRNTAEIFTGWCRMFGSMCLLMVTNVIFLKMLLSVLSAAPSGLDVLAWMVLILTIVKVAQKADAIITRIGLNPAITGDSLGRLLPGTLTYMVVRTAASQITKAVGKSTGGSGRGRAPNSPPGGPGGPRTGSPQSGPGGSGGGAGPGPGGSAQPNVAPQGSFQQNGTQYTSPQQAGSYHSSTVQAENQQATAQEHTASAFYQSGSITEHTASARVQDRKTAVPPGTRRAPAHVKSADTSPGNIQAAAGRPGAAGRAGAAAGIAGAAGVAVGSQVKGGTAGRDHTAGPGAAGVVQRDPAGKPPAPSSAHVTRMNMHKAQGGPVNGAVQATEHTGITVDQATHPTSSTSGQRHPPGVNTGLPISALTGDSSAQPRPGESRFTQRTAQAVPQAPVPKEKRTPVTGQNPEHVGSHQHGHAGMQITAPVQPHLKEVRSSRDMPPAGSGIPKESRQHSPVRQEPRHSLASVTPVVKGTSPGLHHGPAGITPEEQQMPPARQRARTAAPAPTTAVIQPGMKVAPGPKASVKGHSNPATAKQPTRRQRGKKK